CVRKNVNFDFW
nr:immunoglobulin heavy chain junction region [Macaca mulatta]MOV51720.1 immunoglobulin heavy chain junction region [Macaca mulatta]MOV52461.1 immunoglobulin heavy chain junction region [Macaca mulatta]